MRLRLVECLRPQNTCPITGICVLPAPLLAATNAFLETLDRYTLTDIAIDPGRTFPLNYQPRP